MSLEDPRETDLAVLFSLGEHFPQLLERAGPAQNLRRTADSILSDITVDHIEIKMTVGWLLQSGQFDQLISSESQTVQRVRLGSLHSSLSSLFSPPVVQSALTFLAGYLGLHEGEGLLAREQPLAIPGYASPSPKEDNDQDEELCLTSAEAAELLPNLPLMPLEGNELLGAIRRLGDVSKKELVALCGYYKRLAKGGLRLYFIDFYQSLIISKHRHDHPGSRIIDVPVQVLDGGRLIRVHGSVASRHGLRDGYYRLSFAVNPPGAIALNPLGDAESAEARTILRLE